VLRGVCSTIRDIRAVLDVHEVWSSEIVALRLTHPVHGSASKSLHPFLPSLLLQRLLIVLF
jgi:hypothetical protein